MDNNHWLTLTLSAFVRPLASFTGHLEETAVARHTVDSQALLIGVTLTQVAHVKIFIEQRTSLELFKCTTCSRAKPTRASAIRANGPHDRLPATVRSLTFTWDQSQDVCERQQKTKASSWFWMHSVRLAVQPVKRVAASRCGEEQKKHQKKKRWAIGQ